MDKFLKYLAQSKILTNPVQALQKLVRSRDTTKNTNQSESFKAPRNGQRTQENMLSFTKDIKQSRIDSSVTKPKIASGINFSKFSNEKMTDPIIPMKNKVSQKSANESSGSHQNKIEVSSLEAGTEKSDFMASGSSKSHEIYTEIPKTIQKPTCNESIESETNSKILKSVELEGSAIDATENLGRINASSLNASKDSAVTSTPLPNTSSSRSHKLAEELPKTNHGHSQIKQIETEIDSQDLEAVKSKKVGTDSKNNAGFDVDILNDNRSTKSSSMATSHSKSHESAAEITTTDEKLAQLKLMNAKTDSLNLKAVEPTKVVLDTKNSSRNEAISLKTVPKKSCTTGSKNSKSHELVDECAKVDQNQEQADTDLQNLEGVTKLKKDLSSDHNRIEANFLRTSPENLGLTPTNKIRSHELLEEHPEADEKLRKQSKTRDFHDSNAVEHEEAVTDRIKKLRSRLRGMHANSHRTSPEKSGITGIKSSKTPEIVLEQKKPITKKGDSQALKPVNQKGVEADANQNSSTHLNRINANCLKSPLEKSDLTSTSSSKSNESTEEPSKSHHKLSEAKPIETITVSQDSKTFENEVITDINRNSGSHQNKIDDIYSKESAKKSGPTRRDSAKSQDKSTEEITIFDANTMKESYTQGEKTVERAKNAIDANSSEASKILESSLSSTKLKSSKNQPSTKMLKTDLKLSKAKTNKGGIDSQNSKSEDENKNNKCTRIPTPEEFYNEKRKLTSQVEQDKSHPTFKEKSELIGCLSNASFQEKLFSVQNETWSDAADVIDLSFLRTFPLNNPSLPKLKARKKIISVGIFEGGYKKLPSVTKILQKTMPEAQKITLDLWEKKMISEMGEQEFKEYKQSLLDTGEAFHKCIEEKLKENIDPIEEIIEPIEKYWKSIQPVLSSFSAVQLTESRVVHPHLHYQGAIDCLATYKRKRVVVEFKTSSKPKKTIESTYDNPIQLAAYLGALKYDEELSAKVPTASGALLVIAYASGRPAMVHSLSAKDCEFYWNQWRLRLAKFWEMEAKTSSSE